MHAMLDTLKLRLAPTRTLQDDLWELYCFDYLNDAQHARAQAALVTELLRRGKLPAWADDPNTERN